MTIKVYILPVKRINNVDVVDGGYLIHDAILECTEKPEIRKLIMDVTADEDITLSALALETRSPTMEEVAVFEGLPPLPPPPRNLEQELDALKARIEKLEKK